MPVGGASQVPIVRLVPRVSDRITLRRGADILLLVVWR
jgi:hypothetical protein